ncbi:unnamed protein product [Ixodes pacificus]
MLFFFFWCFSQEPLTYLRRLRLVKMFVFFFRHHPTKTTKNISFWPQGRTFFCGPEDSDKTSVKARVQNYLLSGWKSLFSFCSSLM